MQYLPLTRHRFNPARHSNNRYLFVFAAVSALLLPQDCYAYIDPNAGGWLFQLLFPMLVAIGGLFTVFWRNIQTIFDRIFRRGGDRK